MSTTAQGVGGVEMSNVTKRFVTPTGAAMTAIRDVNLVVEPGQFCAIVGPTGCGKSTTLTLAAGLEMPSAGTVKVSGQPVVGITRGASFVFQTDALLPWTVQGAACLLALAALPALKSPATRGGRKPS